MFTKNWWKMALVRAGRTMAQVFVASTGVNVFIATMDIKELCGLVLGSGLCSLATSIAFGMPEADDPTDPRLGVSA